MLAGTPSSPASGSFSPIERPPTQAYPTKYPQPVLPPNFPRNSPSFGQPSISSGPPFTPHMPPTHPPLNGSAIPYSSPPQPSMVPNGMSMFSINLDEKHTNIRLFQIECQCNLCIQTQDCRHHYLIPCIPHIFQIIHCNPLSPINH